MSPFYFHLCHVYLNEMYFLTHCLKLDLPTLAAGKLSNILPNQSSGSTRCASSEMSKIKKELRIETMPVFIDKFEIFFL